MPLMYAGGRTIFRRFSASSPTQLVECISSTLQACGWAAVAATGGYRFLGTSPQGMQIYMFVQDLGHSLGFSYLPDVTITFETLDGTVTGFAHHLVADTAATYQIVAGPCQVFLSIQGRASDIQGSAVCGGVPWVPFGGCGDEIPSFAATQCFWSMGDYNGGDSPRTALIQGQSIFGPAAMNNCEALWNTSYCAPGNSIGSLRIPTLTPAPYIFQAFNYPSPVLWWAGDFLTFEAELVWGDTNATLPVARAQIFDAMIFSKQFAMDVRQKRDGENWINYTDDYLYGSLQLLCPTLDLQDGNYAFIAT